MARVRRIDGCRRERAVSRFVGHMFPLHGESTKAHIHGCEDPCTGREPPEITSAVEIAMGHSAKCVSDNRNPRNRRLIGRSSPITRTS